jgi:hypothetical protein
MTQNLNIKEKNKMKQENDKIVLTEKEYSELIIIKNNAEILQKEAFNAKFNLEQREKELHRYKLSNSSGEDFILSFIIGVGIGSIGFLAVTKMFPKSVIIGCGIVFLAEIIAIGFLGKKFRKLIKEISKPTLSMSDDNTKDKAN